MSTKDTDVVRNNGKFWCWNQRSVIAAYPPSFTYRYFSISEFNQNNNCKTANTAYNFLNTTWFVTHKSVASRNTITQNIDAAMLMPPFSFDVYVFWILSFHADRLWQNRFWILRTSHAIMFKSKTFISFLLNAFHQCLI